MRIRLALALGLAALTLTGSAAGQPPKKVPKKDLKARQGTLKIGDPAPAFGLADADGENPVDLARLRGKPVVLVFGSCT